MAKRCVVFFWLFFIEVVVRSKLISVLCALCAPAFVSDGARAIGLWRTKGFAELNRSTRRRNHKNEDAQDGMHEGKETNHAGLGVGRFALLPAQS